MPFMCMCYPKQSVQVTTLNHIRPVKVVLSGPTKFLTIMPNKGAKVIFVGLDNVLRLVYKCHQRLGSNCKKQKFHVCVFFDSGDKKTHGH